VTAPHDPLSPFRHDHSYLGSDHERNAGRTRLVMALTALMMSAEVAAGLVFGSIALFADGLHMAGHVAVLGAAAYAYSFARRHAGAERYSFGTGKVGDLVAFASAILLGAIAIGVLYESSHRLFAPQAIAFREALVVAVLGFSINLLCARLLWHGDHGHDHGDHEHADHHADHNLQAAYLHLVTDVLTSALVIVALLSGQFLGWVWMDPIMGIVGALVILNWSWSLLRRTGRVLLDATPAVAEDVRRAVEIDPDNRVADLHVWRVGPGHLAAILTIVTREPRPPAYYKSLLASIPGLSHITVEVQTPDPASRMEHERDLVERRLHEARHV
jgi:cation diffusion facilitator family transporter